MFHRPIVSLCLIMSAIAVLDKTVYAQTVPSPTPSVRVHTTYNNPITPQIPITVTIQSLNTGTGLTEYTCLASAPGAIFSNLACGVPNGSQLTGGINGPAVVTGPIIVGSGTAQICWSGKWLFPPNDNGLYAYQSGCSTPNEARVSTQPPPNPTAPPSINLPNLSLPIP